VLQGSAHFENEQRKDRQHEERIAALKQKAAALTPAELASNQASMDARLADLEAKRDLSK
jgi:hypothetical protein